MSVVVSDDEGNLFVFCKGADSAILPLLANQESKEFSDTQEAIEAFAAKGMRTLVFAFKPLSRESVFDEIDQYSVEKDLTLLGATGVEDRLQDCVQDCISDFQDAGVRTWIITGDKNTTAKCIGYASGVFSSQRDLLEVSGEFGTEDKIAEQILRGQVDLLVSGCAISSLVNSLKEPANSKRQNAFVQSLLSTKGLVVYRASPSEKAELVKLVRQK